MKYTVSINEKKQAITVTLADGTQGVAKCSPTDKFDIGTGVELALERAKVAQANRNKPSPSPIASQMSVMMLVKELEKALPKGEMVIVGNGVEMTDRQKAWLHSLTDCKCSCKCSCDCDCEKVYSEEEYDDAVSDAYEEGHSAGYDAGYADALEEMEQMNEEDIEKILDRVREVLEEAIN